MPLRLVRPDDVSPHMFTVLFFIPFVIALIYATYWGIRYYYWFNIRSIEPQFKTILEKYFSYYQHLSPKLKGAFERRVSLFIRGKTFYGKEGLKITDEMRVLIAATAVQITFGFKFFQLPRFSKIIIHPGTFYNEQTKNFHKGEVYPMGRWIRLSWASFLQGFGNPHDGINLGFHEMTHAMSLENRIRNNGAHSYINRGAYNAWKQLALEEMKKINRKEKSLFRTYAGTNLEEFLSVSVEVFFEQTEKFNKYNPSLYKATTHLLQQDPLPGILNRKK
ncbi:MAG: zinc-dependent peptidase [Salibacteraceae bacterium]